MLFLTYSNIWSIFYFFPILYFVTLSAATMYGLSAISSSQKATTDKKKKEFDIEKAIIFFTGYCSPLIIVSAFGSIWGGPNTYAWFNHVFINATQIQLTGMLTFIVFLLLLMILMNSFFTTRDLNDFAITLVLLYYWLFSLFFVNSLFAAIFLIEILSSVVFLFAITSTFSSTTYYNNLSFHLGGFRQSAYPTAFLKSLVFFFWVSLLTSLTLFLFLSLVYLRYYMLDWNSLGDIFKFFTSFTSPEDIILSSFSVLLLLFSILFKCGIAPFFFWKPTFFDGFSIKMLAVYISFYYFFVFIFLIYIISIHFIGYLYYYSHILVVFVILGFFTFLSTLCESLYLKTFLAISSILNSLLVLMVLTSGHSLGFYFSL